MPHANSMHQHLKANTQRTLHCLPNEPRTPSAKLEPIMASPYSHRFRLNITLLEIYVQCYDFTLSCQMTDHHALLLSCRILDPVVQMLRETRCRLRKRTAFPNSPYRKVGISTVLASESCTPTPLHPVSHAVNLENPAAAREDEDIFSCLCIG